MTAQERLDYLLAQVTTNTNRQIIVADIINAVGIEAGALVLGTLQAAAATNPILAAAYQALVTVGISLSDDLRQGMIDQLAVAGNWPNSIRDAMKSLGRITQPRWQLEGYTTEPTLEQITLELDKQRLRNDAASRYNAFVDAVDAWDGSGEEPVL
jgi:phospholipase/lecithinase/hemolysin